MPLIKKIVQIAYHRNGVSGTGFYAVLFVANDDDKGAPLKLGIVFADVPEDKPRDEEGRPAVSGTCAVMRVGPLASLPAKKKRDAIKRANIREPYGVGFAFNSYRGDHYEPELRAEIEKWNAEEETRIAAIVAKNNKRLERRNKKENPK